MRLEATIYPINKAMRTALRILEPGGSYFGSILSISNKICPCRPIMRRSTTRAAILFRISIGILFLLHLVVAVVVFEPEGWIFSIISMILACSEVAQVFARWEGQISGIDTRLESVVVGVGGFRSVCDCKSRPISFKPSCLAHFML